MPPAYLRISEARVIIEGDTLLISPPLDAWVYPKGRFLTITEVGGRVPIVPADQTPILLAGGVRVNGISAQRRPYPFWEFDTLRLQLFPEQEISYAPLYRYFPDTLLQYILREDFESPQLSFRLLNLGEPGAASLRRTIANSWRGFWSGEITFSPAAIFQAESNISFEFPRTEVWLELSVKGTRNLGVGLTREDKRTGSFVSREVLLLLRPSDEGWSTFYIDLTPWVSQGAGLYRYRLYLTSIGDTASTHTLFLDDIRILSLRPI